MSKIEWTTITRNPLVGCQPISEGCENCYAARMARRLKAMGRQAYQGVVDDRQNRDGLQFRAFGAGKIQEPFDDV